MFSVVSVVGHVEDKEGMLSPEEVCIVIEGYTSRESPQCIWTFTIYMLSIDKEICMVG